MSQNGPKFEWRGSDTDKGGTAVFTIGRENFSIPFPSCADGLVLWHWMQRIYDAGIEYERARLRYRIASVLDADSSTQIGYLSSGTRA